MNRIVTMKRHWLAALLAAVCTLTGTQTAWAQATEFYAARTARTNNTFTFSQPAYNVETTVEYVDAGASITPTGDNPEILYYEKLADALADAAAGDVIKLLADETITTGLTINNSITLDLNGHTLTYTGTGTAAITVSANKTVTITGAEGDTPGGISCTNGGICINNAGTLTISRGSFSTSGVAIHNEDGTLTVNGGTISGAFGGIFNNGTAPVLTVTGGSISATEVDCPAINIVAGTFNLSGNPTLSATATGSAINLSSGMVINIDAALSAPATAWTVYSENIETTATTPYTFTSGWSTKMGTANPADYFAYYNNTAAITTRLSSTGEAEFANAGASITRGGVNLYYETFAEIFADANNYANGDVIKLLADEDLGTTGVTIGKNVTLDLNGHTLTYTGTQYALTVYNSKTVIIQDTGTGENPGGITSSSGTAITNESGASLTVTGGTISGRACITNWGDLNVTGGSFSATGGVTWSAISIQTGTFNLSGNPTLTVTNNTSAIYLGHDMVITINDALTAPTTPWTVESYNISDAPATPYIFTSGWSTNMGTAAPASYFAYYDNTAAIATHLHNNEAEFVNAGASITRGSETIYYETFAEIFANDNASLVDGDVVTLLDDETITTGIEIYRSVRLDLNGHTLTYTGTQYALTVKGFTTVIITGATGDTPGGISCTANGWIILNSGTLTISGGAFSSSNPSIDNHGTLTVEGGSITSSNNNDAIYNRGSLTVNGGSITGYDGINSNGTNPSLTITGGSITATNEHGNAILIQTGTFNLSGNPTLSSTDADDASDIQLQTGMVININGTLVAPASPWTVKSYNISGAPTTPYTFTTGWSTIMGTADPAAYFACTTANITTRLHNNEAEFFYARASIMRGSENPTILYYLTQAAALADANDGDVIKLLADEDLGSTGITINKNVTLDLNGHTLTCSNTAGEAIIVSAGKTVTIQDSGTNGTVSNSLGDAICNKGTLIISSGSITGYICAITNAENASLTVNGGTITGTNQSGVYNYGTNANLTVTGGTITGTNNYAISINSGTFNLSGNPTISGADAAIYLGSGRVININDALTAPTTTGETPVADPWTVKSDNIETTPTTPYTFTSGFSTYCLTPTDAVANPADYFACTTANIITRLNSSEAQFAPYPVLTLAADPTTGGTVELADITGTANEPILPDGVTDNGNGTYTVVPGTNVTVKATAVVVDNYHFDKWTDDNDAPYTGTGYTIGYSDYSIISPSDMFPAKSTITFSMGTDDMTMKGNFEKFSVTVPAGKSVTYYTDIKFKVTDANAAIYTISSVSGSEAVLSDVITVAPANTPLLIHNSSNENKTFDIIPTMEDAASVIVSSQFKGTATAKTTADTDIYGPWNWAANTKYYGFNGTNFVWINAAGDVAAHRCWLETSTNSAPILTIDWDGNATGIKQVDSLQFSQRECGVAKTVDSYYDLNGRKLQSKPTKKGVYILNGRKMVVK